MLGSLLQAESAHGTRLIPNEFTLQDLRSLRSPLYMAQKMGKSLARSEILFPAMPPE